MKICLSKLNIGNLKSEITIRQSKYMIRGSRETIIKFLSNAPEREKKNEN